MPSSKKSLRTENLLHFQIFYSFHMNKNLFPLPGCDDSFIQSFIPSIDFFFSVRHFVRLDGGTWFRAQENTDLIYSLVWAERKLSRPNQPLRSTLEFRPGITLQLCDLWTVP